uniref:N-acetyltransferase domain-containing protein n=1 Tax=Ditylenchus dipsaci TaxID=166011 RepID=A0A915D623_9BILA
MEEFLKEMDQKRSGKQMYIELKVNSARKAAIELYQKCGFIKVETETHRIRRTIIEMHLMRKVLAESVPAKDNHCKSDTAGPSAPDTASSSGSFDLSYFYNLMK